jgi:molecular chaperone DnaJ
MSATTEAFAVLDDPLARANYDAALREALEARLRAVSRGPIAQLVDRVIGVRQVPHASGRNRRMRLELPFVQVLRGSETALDLEVDERCEACDGDGFGADGRALLCTECVGLGERFGSDLLRSSWQPCEACGQRGYRPEPPCAACHGRGRERRPKRFVIPIPSAVESGTILRVRGAGEPHDGGGHPGDLLVEVKVSDDPNLTRRGRDLLITRPIPFWLALSGGSMEVPTPLGPATVTVPAGVSDREVLRLHRWGFEIGNHRGDALVTLLVEWPRNLSESARDALIAWGRSLPEDGFPETKRFEAELLSRRSAS